MVYGVVEMGVQSAGKGGAVAVAGCWGLSNGWKPELPEQGDPLVLYGYSGDG